MFAAYKVGQRYENDNMFNLLNNVYDDFSHTQNHTYREGRRYENDDMYNLLNNSRENFTSIGHKPPSPEQCNVNESKTNSHCKSDTECQGNRNCGNIKNGSGKCMGNSGCSKCYISEQDGYHCKNNGNCQGDRYCGKKGICQGASNCGEITPSSKDPRKRNYQKCYYRENKKKTCHDDNQCTGARKCSSSGYCWGESGCPKCDIDESNNKNKCSSKAQCQGLRVCNKNGSCEGPIHGGCYKYKGTSTSIKPPQIRNPSCAI